MKTRMPFGGFFLKLLDEQNGVRTEQAGGRSKTAVGIDPGGNYAMVICI